MTATTVQIVCLILPLPLASCLERCPSYESRFGDEIHIEFPDGHPANQIEAIRAHIDQDLRGAQIGFFDGVLWGDRGIDFISIATDFDRVDEESLARRYISQGVLPADVTVTFRNHVDDEHDPVPSPNRPQIRGGNR